MIIMDDDREGCRSLVCDSNGIIVAEMVFRCMICAAVCDSISDAQKHYQRRHIDSANRHSPDEDLNLDLDLDLEDESDGFELDNEPPSDSELAALDRATLTFNVPSGLKQLQQLNGRDSSASSDREDREDQDEQMDTPQMSKMAENGQQKGAFRAADMSRGGFVTCAVCNITKFYASVQRRYGQFTCMGCAKFFGRFLIKPRKYCCPTLGTCPLDMSPRCKACLLKACIDTYSIDERRMAIVMANRPIKRQAPVGSSSTGYVQQSTQRRESANTIVVGRSSIVQRTALVKKARALRVAASSNSAVRALLSSSSKKQWGCRKCSGCLVEDCGRCNYCLDKPKFGGANTLKKKCVNRRCNNNSLGTGNLSGSGGSGQSSSGDKKVAVVSAGPANKSGSTSAISLRFTRRS